MTDAGKKALEELVAGIGRCEHDGGFDREIGQIGCMLGDKCVCVHTAPRIRASATDFAALEARAVAAEERVKQLEKIIRSCEWYWPEDDTSSEACADSVYELASGCDLPEGEIMTYSRGGVVETRYYAFLSPAEDSQSDDEFEIDEPTREQAMMKLGTELARRAALTGDKP